MQPPVEHACPRCFQALSVAASHPPARDRVALVCPEPYCDYLLTLSERESAAYSSRWSWQRLGWLVRAAG